MKLLRKFSRKKSMVDGPPAVITSSTSTDGSAPYSPMSVVSNGHSDPSSGATAAPQPGRYPRSSSSGGSLPSPAMVTSEARQVLEVFLQRTQSMDRGSTGSMSALVPRHLEVIQEIRHTTRKRSACTGDSSVGSTDALVVESSLPSNSRAHLDHMEVQHRADRDGHHVTDISLHYHDNNDAPGVDRVICTHVRHPVGDEDGARGSCAAKVVTEDSGEVFIDAAMSRQASGNDGVTPDPSLTGLSPLIAGDIRGLTPHSLPSSRAYDAEAEQTPSSGLQQQVAAEAAATGKAWKKRRKTFRSITRWFRNRSDSKSAAVGTKSYNVDGAEATGTSDDVAEFIAQVGTGAWERPPFQSMESYSSSTSSTTSSYGAPSRSLVHPDLAAVERRRKRRKERHSFKWRQSGSGVEAGSSSVFHQLYATLRYGGRKRPVHSGVLTNSDPLLDEHRETAALAKVKLSPSMEAAEDLEDPEPVHQSLPELRREQETLEVLDTFRCAIGAGGCRKHKGQCPRQLGNDDDIDGARPRVDETKLHLDFNSSNSQSSQGGNTASSPDGLGPDGVAPQREVDRVARLLDEVAKSIDMDLKGVGRNRERRKSVPNLPGAPRSPSRERAASTNRRGQAASESSTMLSASTPMLNEEAQKAMRAKARRMKSQSHEDLVSEDLISQLIDCDTYDHFESLIKRSDLRSYNNNIWKQITMLYMLTRKIIRVVRRRSRDREERENAIKDFAMTFFNTHFASFVVKRGGWGNLIEMTEDSELD